ncbi:MAG TPA: PilZ domain-containing protein, partial [Pyrinomonadaceae bacterium]
RRAPRAPMMLPVAWGRTGERPREAETGDLSLGGCFVMTSEQVVVGERVIVTLPCAATAGLRLSGEITYRMEIGFGVRFNRMAEAARASLTLLLADYYRSLEGAGRLSARDGSHTIFRTTP